MYKIVESHVVHLVATILKKEKKRKVAVRITVTLPLSLQMRKLLKHSAVVVHIAMHFPVSSRKTEDIYAS